MLIGKATITEKTGNRVNDRIHFRAEFDTRPTPGELDEAQLKAGYHPLGYFGPNDHGSQLAVRPWLDVWVATWCCSASCD